MLWYNLTTQHTMPACIIVLRVQDNLLTNQLAFSWLSDCFSLTANQQAWEQVTISEEAEGGQQVASIIQVPAQVCSVL